MSDETSHSNPATKGEDIARSRQLCRDAQAAIELAVSTLTRSRDVIGRSQDRRLVWSEFWASPNRMLVCCAYCARLRRNTGEWVAIHTALSESLHRSDAGVLSHAFCPECIARHFPSGIRAAPGESPG
jgi:hypothetical protein